MFKISLNDINKLFAAFSKENAVYAPVKEGDLSNYIAVVSCGNKIKPLSQGDLIDYIINASGTMDSANTT